MTPQETAVIGKVVEEVAKPFSNLIGRMFGPIADAVGDTIRNRYLEWQRKGAKKVIADVDAVILEAEFEPREIAPKILFPALESAILDADDDELRPRWVALLANAADPRQHVGILPSFPEILKQLSFREAKLLDGLYDHVRADAEKSFGGMSVGAIKYTNIDAVLPMIMYGQLGLTRQPAEKLYSYTTDKDPQVLKDIAADESEYELAMANLIRLQLIEKLTQPKLQPKFTGQKLKPGEHAELELNFETHYLLTPLGFEFVRACRPPRPTPT